MRKLANLAVIVVLAHLTGCCCGFPLIQSPTQSLRDLEVPAPTFAATAAVPVAGR